MKKIAAGYYTDKYKGVTFEVCKVDEIKEIAWYFLIGNKPAEDWHSSKNIAISAAKEFIDENYN